MKPGVSCPWLPRGMEADGWEDDLTISEQAQQYHARGEHQDCESCDVI